MRLVNAPLPSSGPAKGLRSWQRLSGCAWLVQGGRTYIHEISKKHSGLGNRSRINFHPDLNEILADNDKHSQVLSHGSSCTLGMVVSGKRGRTIGQKSV